MTTEFVYSEKLMLAHGRLDVFDVPRQIFDELPGMEFQYRRENGTVFYLRHGSISDRMPVTFHCEEPPLRETEPQDAGERSAV